MLLSKRNGNRSLISGVTMEAKPPLWPKQLQAFASTYEERKAKLSTAEQKLLERMLERRAAGQALSLLEIERARDLLTR